MAAVAGILLAGCTKEENVAFRSGSLDMTVKASIGSLTKASYNGVKTTFLQGDSLSLYAWLGSSEEVSKPLVVDGVVNKLGEDGAWTPETQMLWKNVHDDHYFIAVSPAHKVVDFLADPFVLVPDKYDASDLLIANELDGLKATPDFTPAPVSLNFSHALAKLNVNLKFRSQWAETPEVTSVATTAKNSYTVNYLTKEVTATGDDTQVALSPLENAASGYALSYSGLQVPQEDVSVITIVIDGKAFVYNSEEPITLESGKITTIGLIVGREKLELAGVTVTDWVEGTTYTEEGEALISDNFISGPVALHDLKIGDIVVEGAVISSESVYDCLILMPNRYSLSGLIPSYNQWLYSCFPLSIAEDGYFEVDSDGYMPVTEYPADYGDAWEVVDIFVDGLEYWVYLAGINKADSQKIALDITSPALGQVIGDDGKNYAYESLPSGVSPVARILAINGDNGIALALTDEGGMDWDTAVTACDAHTPAFRGGEWSLPTEEDWYNMLNAAGGPNALRSSFAGIGGTDLNYGIYWSSTLGYYSGEARAYDFNDWVFFTSEMQESFNVRACLKFKVKQSGGSMGT